MTKITFFLKVAIVGVAIATTTFAILMPVIHSGYQLTGREKRIHSFFEIERGALGLKYGPPIVAININVTVPVFVVDERFVSVGATMGSLKRTLGHTFNSTRFRTVARGLSPAVYRFGGAEADFTIFKNDDNPDEQRAHKLGKLRFKNMTMSARTWDDLNEFARDVGWDIFFCLNALLRNGTKWDPTNAMELLDYTSERGFKVMWSLGNEPNGFVRKANVSISPEQMADAFHTLRNLVSSKPSLRGSFIAGPDTSAPKKSSNLQSNLSVQLITGSETYLDQFLQHAGNSTNVTTFHFYFTNGRTASIQNFTSPAIANLVELNAKCVRDLINKYRPQLSRIWISESGLTFGGGSEELNQSFITGLLVLDKLGMAASTGIELLVHQNLAGKNSGLLDGTFHPRLTYWLLLYHKRLMGTRVLNVSEVTSSRKSASHKGDNFDFSDYIRIYAHCTKTGSKYAAGSVTLMIINMVPIEEIHVNVDGVLQESRIHEYLFKPMGVQGILSPDASLNGERLTMTDDLTLPNHAPRVMAPRSTIIVPPQMYGFYVLPDAKATACLL